MTQIGSGAAHFAVLHNTAHVQRCDDAVCHFRTSGDFIDRHFARDALERHALRERGDPGILQQRRRLRIPPRPKPVPNASGMFAFADREHVTEVLTASGWAPPRFEKLDMDLDIAAGRGLEEAVVQPTEIGAVNSWLRNQPAQVISAAVASLREALAPYADGVSVRLRGAMWLIGSAPA